MTGLLPWGGLREAPLAGARIVVAGIPYDGSAVYRPGARHAPAALRHLSRVMPPLDERGRYFGDLTLHDMGDLDLGTSVQDGWRGVSDTLAKVPADAFLTVLGGDHCSVIPVLAAQARRHPGLAVLWLDAHPDLCDTSRGGSWTVGCALRRSIDPGGLPPESAVLAACRDFDVEELAFIKEHAMTLVTAAEMASEPAAATARIVAAIAGRPVHVSFDIDALDPAFAPGTEIPSPGGLDTRQALQLMEAVAQHGALVGLDVCEVSPPLDRSEITQLAALKVIFETWARLGNR